MKLDFQGRHFVIRPMEDAVTIHSVNSGYDTMYSSHSSITNALDDLHQRMCRTGFVMWAAVWELASTNGVWISIVPATSNGIEYTNLAIIAEGTPAEIYNLLIPHLQMLRGRQ